jgi:hypothetical protein
MRGNDNQNIEDGASKNGKATKIERDTEREI